MTTEELEKNQAYQLSWVDGSDSILCVFERKHRGFLIFIDENDVKVICRPKSIKEIKKHVE